MMGYDKNMKKLGETSSAAEIFIDNKAQQAKRDHFVRRIQLERDLARTANVASKMAACVETLVGGDRKVLELSVSSYASTSSELARIFNQLSEFYRTEARDAGK
nr:MAG TPA: hypothetical protein [Caudoviricetes sp.]